MAEYATYPIAMDRAKAYINHNDISDIVSLFEKDYGQSPKILLVNPKMLKYVENTDGIEISGHPGVATWEIWVHLQKNPLANVPKIEGKAPQSKFDVSKIVVGIILPKRIMKQQKEVSQPLTMAVKKDCRGRPPKVGKVSRVTDWRRRKKLQGVLAL